MEIAQNISVDPQIHHGAPVITGTRMPVSIVVGSLYWGWKPECRRMNSWPLTVFPGLIMMRWSYDANWKPSKGLSPDDYHRRHITYKLSRFD
ncbi:MAG: DUF433 domain-containing protein [Blastocatellia bacterium]|nr:DUF433 domain-containing protein [Blastocatellia bacterium]